MKLTFWLSLLSVASAISYCPPRPATTAEQTTIFYELVTKFYLKKNIRAAFEDHFSPQWTEHSPLAPPGTLNDTITALSGLAAISNFTIIHAGFYNNTGYVHLRQDTQGSAPEAIADIFGYNGTCVVEHWDITQAKPNNSVNPLAMW